jgi:hypothetical protein
LLTSPVALGLQLQPAPTAPRVVSPAAAINPPRIEPTASPITTQTEAIFSTPDATQAANITAYGLTFYSDVDKFSVVFPVVQSLDEHWVDMEIQGEKINCRLLFAPDNGAFWEVQVCDLPPATLILWGDGLVLEAARDQTLQTYPPFGTVEWQDAGAHLQGPPARHLVMQTTSGGNPGTYVADFYLAGSRLYRVDAYVFRENWNNRMATIQPFLDTFYIENP